MLKKNCIGQTGGIERTLYGHALPYVQDVLSICVLQKFPIDWRRFVYFSEPPVLFKCTAYLYKCRSYVEDALHIQKYKQFIIDKMLIFIVLKVTIINE